MARRRKNLGGFSWKRLTGVSRAKRQFSCATGIPWSKLAKNLKAELDEEKIESFRGTVSLSFERGKAIAAKIIDARGIESLKILR